ncbi:MAG: phage tail protein [Dehalococcoidia bacterium]
MAQFTVNTTRFDPYKSFKFRIKWDGRYVAGVSRIGALKRTTEPVKHREGGDPSTQRLSPSTWSFDPIQLERGVTHDPEFEAWSNLVYSSDGDAAISLKNFRKDVIIELLNEQGTVVKAYKVYRAWVSEYQALPELDANGNAVAIEQMTLQNEGWERDEAVAEPTET